MEGKFNIWQKCLEIVCFVLILASSIYKGQSSPFLCVNSSFSYIKYVYAAFIFSNVL